MQRHKLLMRQQELNKLVSTDAANKVADSMKKHGGSFVKKLGELIWCADYKNQDKIKETWPREWKIYHDWIKKTVKSKELEDEQES